jgi:hypothetical protein
MAGPSNNFWASKKNFLVPVAYFVAVAVVGVLVFLVVLSKWSASTAGVDKQTQDAVQRLVAQAARWGDASSQDSSLLLRLQHANYSVAYIRAAKLLASEQDIKRFTSIDVFELQRALEDQQQAEIKLLASECPALKNDSEYAIAAGYVA